LDEFFEILTLTQTEKMPNTPIILMTKEYWQPLMDFVKNTLIKNATVSEGDANNLYLADTPEEALKILQTHTGPS
jgi:predicted Rossmann-fold nucleotide-binding protein